MDQLYPTSRNHHVLVKCKSYFQLTKIVIKAMEEIYELKEVTEVAFLRIRERERVCVRYICGCIFYPEAPLLTNCKVFANQISTHEKYRYSERKAF